MKLMWLFTRVRISLLLKGYWTSPRVRNSSASCHQYQSKATDRLEGICSKLDGYLLQSGVKFAHIVWRISDSKDREYCKECSNGKYHSVVNYIKKKRCLNKGLIQSPFKSHCRKGALHVLICPLEKGRGEKKPHLVLTQCFQLSPFVIRCSLAKSFKSFGNHFQFSFRAISKKLKASNGSLW